MVEIIRKAWVAIQWGIGNILRWFDFIDGMGWTRDKKWKVDYYWK